MGKRPHRTGPEPERTDDRPRNPHQPRRPDPTESEPKANRPKKKGPTGTPPDRKAGTATGPRAVGLVGMVGVSFARGAVTVCAVGLAWQARDGEHSEESDRIADEALRPIGPGSYLRMRVRHRPAISKRQGTATSTGVVP